MESRSFLSDAVHFPDLGNKCIFQLINERLKHYRAVKVTGFPLAPETLCDLLAHFGTVLTNYGVNGDGTASSVHPCLNRVKLIPNPKKYVHGRPGPLPPHSARSWRAPRPAYFAMLMVNAGWVAQEKGNNGESKITPWRNVLKVMRESTGPYFNDFLQCLTKTPIIFHANNVVEHVSDLPLLYNLKDSVDYLDLGARVKQDITQKIDSIEIVGDRKRYLLALETFLGSAKDSRASIETQMESGDLIMIDNNRFGHGRTNFPTTRQENGDSTLNPRELWSATVE